MLEEQVAAERRNRSRLRAGGRGELLDEASLNEAVDGRTSEWTGGTGSRSRRGHGGGLQALASAAKAAATADTPGAETSAAGVMRDRRRLA